MDGPDQDRPDGMEKSEFPKKLWTFISGLKGRRSGRILYPSNIQMSPPQLFVEGLSILIV